MLGVVGWLLMGVFTCGCARAPASAQPAEPAIRGRAPASARSVHPKPAQPLRTARSTSSAAGVKLSVTQTVDNEYREPSEAVVRLLTTPPPPAPVVHVASRQLALVHSEATIPIERLSRPAFGLAGFRIDAASSMRAGKTYATHVEVHSLDGTRPPVALEPPQGALLDHVQFSPSGRYLVATSVWPDVARPVLFDLLERRDVYVDQVVSGVWDAPCAWAPGERLLCHAREPGDVLPETTIRPSIIEHWAGAAPSRTYRHLLQGADDDELFDSVFSTTPVLVTMDGRVEALELPPAIRLQQQLSPDGEHLFALELERPYSRITTADRFGRRALVHSLGERRAWVEIPLPNGGAWPTQGLPTGPRDFAWAAGSPASLTWRVKGSVGVPEQAFIWERPFDLSPRPGARPPLSSDKAPPPAPSWLSAPPDQRQTVVAALDDDSDELLVTRESFHVPRNYFVVSRDGDRQITDLRSPYGELRGVRRLTLKYRRADGVPLSGALYMPPGKRLGDRVPTVLWIYPSEHTDSDYAPPVERHRFWSVAGPSRFALLLAGYAVLDQPSMPIIGRPGRQNDSYLPQLVASAEAAVAELDRIGATDPERVAVAGRSYGAFSAANLLIHTRLFRTAIAMNGAYNRTLTPFGFQNEQRTFWQATDLYTRISPFFSAHLVRRPILLVHGQEDDNPGTPPLQSERFFQALAGNGAPVRWVSLPLEGHQVRGRESVLHVAAEMIDWLDRYLAPPTAPRDDDQAPKEAEHRRNPAALRRPTVVTAASK